MFSLAYDQLSRSKSISVLQKKTKLDLLMSDASLLYSMLALERGATPTALTHAKQSVRLLRRAWASTEEEMGSKISPSQTSRQKSTDRLAEELSHLNLSTTTAHMDVAIARTYAGATFWNLVTPLFRGLEHLSQVYAHHGMFQETLYYAQQAYKLSEEAGSETHLAMAAAILGSAWLKSGTLDKGSEFLMEAQRLSGSCEKNRDTAVRMYHFGNMHGLLGDRDAEIFAYDNAQDILKSLTDANYIESLDNFGDKSLALEEEISKLTLSKRRAPASRRTPGRPKVASTRGKPVARAGSPVEQVLSVAGECPQLISLKAAVLRHKAQALMSDKKFVEALALHNQAEAFTNTQIDVIDQGLGMAKQLLLQSIEQMNADPVYSVLQDSTISFPSIVGFSKSEKHGDRLSVAKVSPPRKVQMSRNNRERGGSKSPAPDSFFDKLRQAQERLVEVYTIAMTIAPVAVIHRVSALLNSVAILLSAAGHVKGKPLANPGFASCSIGMLNPQQLDNLYTNAFRNGTNSGTS
jgi:separase